MKAKVFILGAILATSLVAVDFNGKTNADIIASTDSKNPTSLAESAFEIDKRVGAQKTEIRDTCFKIHNLIKNELSGKTPEERQKFMDEFRKAYNAKLDALSTAQKAEFQAQACGRGFKKDKMKPFKNDAKGGFEQGPKFRKDFNGTRMSPRPRFGQGDAEIPPMPPKPKPAEK